MRALMLLTTLGLGLMLFTSCGNVKKLQYLQGPLDTAALSKINYIEPVIQNGDILGITVYSDNAEASARYNQPGASAVVMSTSGLGTTPPAAGGYLVSEEGSIQLFQLGQLKVIGLTKKQLADKLTKEFIRLNVLTNPFVEVRFNNFKVTMIGDFNKPGIYTFPSEKVNIFDAIGMAGDLTTYARRDNILIVREVDGERKFGRIDISKPDAFLSPYYYLQQNDMVVIDVTKAKAVAADPTTMRNISIGTSILSVIAIVVSFFRN